MAAGVKFVDFKSLTQNDARYPHIGALNSTVSYINDWAFKFTDFYKAHKAFDFTKGERVLGVGSFKCKGGRICSNEVYFIKDITDTDITLSNPKMQIRTISRKMAPKYLRRMYCRTVHSTQGCTLGNKIYIHDFGNKMMCSDRWLRTAISRCGTLDITIVENTPSCKQSTINIESRISGHKASDIEKKLVWTSGDYVSVEWARQKLKCQHNRCYICNEALDQDYTIDRKNNDLPHIKDNCSLSCRMCQEHSNKYTRQVSQLNIEKIRNALSVDIPEIVT
jgi:hypothetical protein